MARNFKETIKHRRTYYSISNTSPISDKEIQEIVDYAVLHVPSAFNSQSTRAVLLLGENHLKLWSIVKETLRKIVPEKSFKATEDKIAEFDKMLKDLPNTHAELIVQYQKEKEEKLKSQKVLDFIQERADENKVLFKISSDENISINNSRKR